MLLETNIICQLFTTTFWSTVMLSEPASYANYSPLHFDQLLCYQNQHHMQVFTTRFWSTVILSESTSYANYSPLHFWSLCYQKQHHMQSIHNYILINCMVSEPTVIKQWRYNPHRQTDMHWPGNAWLANLLFFQLFYGWIMFKEVQPIVPVRPHCVLKVTTKEMWQD